jgi:hypothetical protein
MDRSRHLFNLSLALPRSGADLDWICLFRLNNMAAFGRGLALIAWVAGMALIAHFSFLEIERPLHRFVKAQLRRASLQKPRDRDRGGP